MLNVFLLTFFIVIGIAGLFYQVDSGVFIGLGLIPWQIMRLKINRKINLGAIIITALIGGGYFIYIGKWVYLFLFLFIELYNFWGYLNTGVE